MFFRRYCTIDFQEIQHKQEYFSDQMTLLLVLEGHLHIEDNGMPIDLSTGNIFCINLNHFVTFLSDNTHTTILFLRINPIFFASQFPSLFNVKFVIPQNKASFSNKQAIDDLENDLIQLFINEFSQQDSRAIRQLILLEAIILQLVEHFKLEDHTISLHSTNYQTKEILTYIDTHYTNGLSVKEIAEYFFLSESTLSKLFKKETGEYLSKYLRKLQIQRSLAELLYSEQSIEQIASHNGFKSSKVYREQFKQLFHFTPTDYREKYKAKNNEKSITANIHMHKKEHVISKLYHLLQQDYSFVKPIDFSKRTKHLLIDSLKPSHKRKTAATIIHLEYLTDINKQPIQEELLELIKENNLQILTCRDFFKELPVSYLLAKKSQLNSFPAFEELEQALAFIQQHKLHVMIYLQSDSTDSNKKEFFAQILRYIRHRLGEEQLKNFSFNYVLTKTEHDFNYHSFQSFYQAVKSFDRTLQVGLTLPIDDPFEESSLKKQVTLFLEKLDNPFDFFTLFSDPNYIYQFHTTLPFTLEKTHHYTVIKVRAIAQVLTELKVNVPLFLTDWNTVTGKTINYNGLFFRGALIVQDLLMLENLVTGIGFWLNVASHEHFNKELTHSISGLDLYHFHQNKRPSFYSLQLANRPKGDIIIEDESFLFTHHQSTYYLLIWNTNYFDPSLSTEKTFVDSQSLELNLSLALPVGHYQVKEQILNRDSGALFYHYLQFDQASSLDNETIEYIKAKNRPHLNVFDIHVTQTFDYQLSLDSNAVSLIEFKKIYP